MTPEEKAREIGRKIETALTPGQPSIKVVELIADALRETAKQERERLQTAEKLARDLDANTITALRRENDRMRSEMAAGSWFKEADIDAMQTETEKLRGALRWVLDHSSDPGVIKMVEAALGPASASEAAE